MANLLALVVAAILTARSVAAFDVVLNAQGEYLDAYPIDGTEPPRRVVLIDPDPPSPGDPHGPLPRVGRHVNGKLCFFPKKSKRHGQFVLADDTYREACVDRHPPDARCALTNPRAPGYVGKDVDGWAVFGRSARWTGLVIHTEGVAGQNEIEGNIDPQGCAFDADGNFWGTDVGHGNFGDNDGSLVVFFPGPRERYDTYCFLDKHLAAPGMPVMDAAGSFYVPEPAALHVAKFSPPFPKSAADCANSEHLVTTPPTKTLYTLGDVLTTVGIANVPGSDHFYLSSALIPPIINEYDAGFGFVRTIVPDGMPLNPLGMAVGSDGTVYYSELNLDPTTFNPRCGRVSRVRFDATGSPLPPEVLGEHLQFPDGVTVVDSRRLRVNWDTLAPAPDIPPDACGGE